MTLIVYIMVRLATAMLDTSEITNYALLATPLASLVHKEDPMDALHAQMVLFSVKVVVDAD